MREHEADVLPLTPSGNATERPMLAAFDLEEIDAVIVNRNRWSRNP
mgnify:CR=1 FL=1